MADQKFILPTEEDFDTPTQQDASSQFALPEEVDFMPETAPRRPVDTRLGISSIGLARAGAGKAMTDIASGAEDVVRRMTGNVTPEWQQSIAEKRRIDRMLMENPEAKWGEFGGRVASGMLMPARTLGQAVAGQALMSAIEEPREGAADYIKSGGLGALAGGAGYGIGAGLAKGIATARGDFGKNAEARALDLAARKEGLDMSVGDLMPSSIARTLENVSPFRYSRLQGQAEQLRNILDKGGETQSAIADSIQRAYQQHRAVNRPMWGALDQKVASGTVDPVKATETQKIAREFLDLYPQVINSFSNKKAVESVKALAGAEAPLHHMLGMPNAPTGADMTFTQLQDVRHQIGNLIGQAERQYIQGTVDKEVIGKLKQMYKSIYDDMDKWGEATKNAEAHSLFAKARDYMKENVLPFEKYDFSRGAIHGKYEDKPEALLRDVISPMRKTQVEKLYGLLDDEGRQTLEMVRKSDRAAKLLANSTEPSMGLAGSMMIGTGAAVDPVSAGLVGAASFLKNKLATTPVAKRMALADPDRYMQMVGGVLPRFTSSAAASLREKNKE